MKRHLLSTAASLLGLAAVAALTLNACQTGKSTSATTATTATTAATPPGTARPRFIGGETGRSGAQLWAENCARCHNLRSPASLSDAEWAVAAQHMRIRANLTAEEHRKILEFLQSAN